MLTYQTPTLRTNTFLNVCPEAGIEPATSVIKWCVMCHNIIYNITIKIKQSFLFSLSCIRLKAKVQNHAPFISRNDS